MIRKAVFLAILVGLTAGCGERPLPTDTTEQPLNGHSDPAGWQNGTQPWLCAGPAGAYGSWLPMTNPWPMNNTNSWCQWQPNPATQVNPWNVTPCYGSGPTQPGTMDLFSQDNYGGNCARIAGLYNTYTYQWDADLIEVNGWHSTWIPPGGTPQFVGVKSMKVAPRTAVLLCQGPFTGPSGAPCNAYVSWGITTFTLAVGYPNMIQSNGLFFETAAIQIGSF